MFLYGFAAKTHGIFLDDGAKVNILYRGQRQNSGVEVAIMVYCLRIRNISIKMLKTENSQNTAGEEFRSFVLVWKRFRE